MATEDYMKKYKRCLYEYTNAAGSFDLSEADDDDAPDMGMPTDEPMGNTPVPDGSMDGEAGAPGPEGFSPQGAEQNAGMDGMGGGQVENMPEPTAQPAPESGEMTQEEPGDEVIDVDELTKSQEDAEKKIDRMNDKFEKLMGAVDLLIKQNKERDAREAELLAKTKEELEKRLPTPEQRLTMRSTKSAPYSMTPSEYMDNYAPDNYSDADDNNGADDPQYKIMKSDIDNFTDYASIARDLDVEHQGLHDILGF